MISIKRSLEDHERAQSLALGLTETLRATLGSLRQYVVDTDPSLVDQFRTWAGSLLESLEACLKTPADESFGELRSSIRAGLRDYRDRAGRYVTELRERLAATTAAMHQMLSSLESNDSDGEAKLKGEIGRLTTLETASNLDEVRTGLQKSVASLSACVTQLRQEKNVIIAQLTDEIRTLQQSLDDARQGASKDAVTGAYKRKEFERLLTRSVTTERTKSVIRLTLQNLPALAASCKQDVVNQLLGAVCARVRTIVPEDAVVGQWRDNVFCILLRTADTRTVMTELIRQCNGKYVCMEGMAPRTVSLEVGVTSFTCSPGADAAQTIHVLDSFEDSKRTLVGRNIPATVPPAA